MREGPGAMAGAGEIRVEWRGGATWREGAPNWVNPRLRARRAPRCLSAAFGYSDAGAAPPEPVVASRNARTRCVFPVYSSRFMARGFQVPGRHPRWPFPGPWSALVSAMTVVLLSSVFSRLPHFPSKLLCARKVTTLTSPARGLLLATSSLRH